MPTTQLTLNRKSTTERSEKDHKLFEIIEICLSGENLGTTQINLKDLLVHIQTQVSNVYNVHEPSGVEKINRELHSHDTTTTRTTYSNTSTTTRKHVQLADLQHLLHSQSFAEPTILLRHGCVVLNLYPIHAIIVSNKLIVCVTEKSLTMDALVEEIMAGVLDVSQNNDTHNTSQQQPNTFPESAFYSSLFTIIVALYTQQHTQLALQVNDTVRNFNKSLTQFDVKPQQAVRSLKQSIGDILHQVSHYRTLFSSLINMDSALVGLSVLCDNNKTNESDMRNNVDTMTNLLETHLLDFNTLHTQLTSLQVKMQHKEDMSAFRLDAQEYNLLTERVSLKSIMTIVAVGTVWTSLFAMNINSGLEKRSLVVFWVFFALLTLFVVVMIVQSMRYFTQYYIRSKAMR